MVGYIMAAIFLLTAAVLAVLLVLDRRRMRRLSEAISDFLDAPKGPMPYSLREGALAPVENGAAELENRILVLSSRLREENERTASLTADISHQLKTPLASLRLFCEMDESPHMEQQLSQIERMEKLIFSILRLEKLTADGYEFHFAQEALRPLIESTWAELRPLWPERYLDLEGDACIRCDKKWLGEAFANILKNACEHTAPGGHIRIRLEQAEHTLYCSCEDDGGGVSDEDLPHLFERFYRAREGNGSGLGLAIVREIVSRHHGRVRACSGTNGLRVEIELPLQDLARAFSD